MGDILVIELDEFELFVPFKYVIIIIIIILDEVGVKTNILKISHAICVCVCVNEFRLV